MNTETIALGGIAAGANYLVVGQGGIGGLAPDVTAAVAAGAGALLVALAATDAI